MVISARDVTHRFLLELGAKQPPPVGSSCLLLHGSTPLRMSAYISSGTVSLNWGALHHRNYAAAILGYDGERRRRRVCSFRSTATASSCPTSPNRARSPPRASAPVHGYRNATVSASPLTSANLAAGSSRQPAAATGERGWAMRQQPSGRVILFHTRRWHRSRRR